MVGEGGVMMARARGGAREKPSRLRCRRETELGAEEKLSGQAGLSEVVVGWDQECRRLGGGARVEETGGGAREGGVGGRGKLGSGGLSAGQVAGESFVFSPVVSHRGLQRLGGGAWREWLGRGKEPNTGAGGSFPDLLRDFFPVSGP